MMIDCDQLVKIFKTDSVEVVALQGLDMQIESGEFVAIVGSSGSGKSTLLNIIGGLDRPSAGHLMIDGKDMLKLTHQQNIQYKRETIGFVWQNNARNLIPYLTALENVEIPMMLSKKKSKGPALELLEAVGLGDRKHHKLQQLSGGEQKRVAIAIALANHPKILLADEPTGSLDSTRSKEIMDLFRQLNLEFGLTVIIVTHDPQLAYQVERVISIRDGKTSNESVGSEHNEYVLLDKVGRLQIPQSYLESIGLKGQSRIKVELIDQYIKLSPPFNT